MLKQNKELALLSVFDRMQAETGKSMEELAAEHLDLCQKTCFAMCDRKIERPRPHDPKVKAKDFKQISGTYVLQRSKGKGLKTKPVIIFVHDSIALEADDKLWWHVSFSRSDLKMPTYADQALVREKIFGDRWCIQYFPSSNQYVSDHPTCLHLWHCLERNPLPDFRKFGTI